MKYGNDASGDSSNNSDDGDVQLLTEDGGKR